MKILALTCLSVAFSIALARADLTIVQHVEGTGPEAGTMTIKIKGEKARIDVSPEMSTIIDSKSGDILNVMNKDKKFLRISGAKARAAAEMAVATDKKDQATARPQIKATGKKETINGYETEEYTFDAPTFQATYWIAPGYPNAADIVRQMQAITPQAWGIKR